MDMQFNKERSLITSFWSKLPYAFFAVSAILLCASLNL
jgi:hypothetical protein